MSTSPYVRPVTRLDLPALKVVIDSLELFPSSMLDGMVKFEDAEDSNAGKEFWVVYDKGDGPIGVAQYALELMTNRTYNLLLLAVHADHLGTGIGTELVQHIERDLVSRGARILIVETSGLPTFDRSLAFYVKNGFKREATIPEFYDVGDHKIVLWKKF